MTVGGNFVRYTSMYCDLVGKVGTIGQSGFNTTKYALQGTREDIVYNTLYEFALWSYLSVDT